MKIIIRRNVNKLFIELFDNKFPVEHLTVFDLTRHDKEDLEDDEDDN